VERIEPPQMMFFLNFNRFHNFKENRERDLCTEIHIRYFSQKSLLFLLQKKLTREKQRVVSKFYSEITGVRSQI
jgi:hypothetical protein